MADAFKDSIVLGGSGPNDSETYPHLMNNTIGTRFRVVSGYRANSAVFLAMERGEGRGRHRVVVVGQVGAAKLGTRQAGAGAGAVRARPRA